MICLRVFSSAMPLVRMTEENKRMGWQEAGTQELPISRSMLMMDRTSRVLLTRTKSSTHTPLAMMTKRPSVPRMRTRPLLKSLTATTRDRTKARTAEMLDKSWKSFREASQSKKVLVPSFTSNTPFPSFSHYTTEQKLLPITKE